MFLLPFMSSLTARLIGGLGRILVTLGLLVLLFAAFEYWGTSLAEAQAQDSLEAEFDARLASVDSSGSSSPDPTLGASSDERSTSDSLTPPASTVQYPMLDLADIPKPGEAAGRILIPSIGVDKTWVQGVDRDDLRQGPGHYPRSPFPGQPGNAAIAGHRTTYGAPFVDLDKLVPGDEIVVETLQGRFSYIVEGHDSADGNSIGHFIVPPTATWVLDDHGDSRLTLTACHPKRSAAQRIIVTAILNSTPAPITPMPIDVQQPDSVELNNGLGADENEDVTGVDGSDDLEDTLGWQPQHAGKTMSWAGATALVALAGWLLGRLWRRWPAYLIAAAPLMVCLFVCFTHLDKMLPAV